MEDIREKFKKMEKKIAELQTTYQSEGTIIVYIASDKIKMPPSPRWHWD